MSRLHLFERHVSRTSQDRVRIGQIDFSGTFPTRETEVHDDRLLPLIQHDVRRFEVAMDHTGFMSSLNRESHGF